MNQTKSKLLLFIITIMFLSSCNSDTDNISLSDKKELQSFKLEASLNSKLNQDVIGVIEGDRIKLSIPEEALQTKLIASFTHSGKTVYINGKEQQSGVTTNNFATPLIYKVEAEDKSINTYTVEAITLEDSGKEITSFSFTKELNSSLKEDISLVITENEITGSILSIPQKTLIASFTTSAKRVTINDVEQISGVTANDFTNPVTYTLTTDQGYQKKITVTVKWESALPHVYIETEGGSPIVSKDDYLKATVEIKGKGLYTDYIGATQVKGRGNSTWGLPKKPYRLKLDKKTSLLGLSTEKDWVLLANYLDPTLMLNAVAMKVGQLLELPFTNHIVPVEVTVNGIYMGSYMFTEQVEISESRVNVDETNGVLLEIDTNYDEDYKFKSTNYQLPVMVKDPDISSPDQFNKIKDDFHQLENAMASPDFPNTNYLDYIDANSLVNYLIVYNFTHNMEINHPKSTYMHKDVNGKYFMGPIWDFDWGFDYEGKQSHFASFNRSLFAPSGSMEPALGRAFFSRFLQDPVIKSLYKQKWNEFKSSKLNDLYLYIDKYAADIEISKTADYNKWKYAGKDFQAEVKKLNTWLRGRVTFIDNEVSSY